MIIMSATTLPQAGQTVVPAATVIVFRNGAAGVPELLMVKRSKALAVAGSAVVFPGGKVAPADLAMAGGDAERAARIAAVRETLEETGLLICTDRAPSAAEAEVARDMLAKVEDLAPVLDRFGWALDTDKLTAFAHWLPNFKPGRIFDTRFYLADIGSGAVALTPDLGENTELYWITATEALNLIEQGELQAIYPTRRNLERLALFGDFAAVHDNALATPLVTICPWIVERASEAMLCIPGNAGYPITEAPLSQIQLDDAATSAPLAP
jgi:8-oxo-dGTP pyrophosphatase MutT (NUDIX family)